MLGFVESPRAFGSPLLVSGPESLLAERAAAEFVAQARHEQPEAGLTRVDAGDLDAGMLAEAAGGSLLASASILQLNDLGSLPTELAEPLLTLLADPGPDLALVLVHAGGNKGRGLLDRIRKTRIRQVDCPAIKTWDLPQFVLGEVRRHGGRADQPSARALVDAVGSDTRSLAAAVRQLLDDCDDGRITEAAVHRYFGGRADVTSFAVADDALSGRLGGALEKLRWALASGVAPVLVTSALASNLRNLGRYLDARDSRMRDAELARQIGVPPWKLKDLSRLSRDWRPAGVARAIAVVAVADARTKGAASDPGFALEQAVLAVIGCRGRD